MSDISWPKSRLGKVALSIQGLNQSELETMDFPPKWNDQHLKRKAEEQLNRDKGGPRDFGGAQYDSNFRGGPDFGRNTRRDDTRTRRNGVAFQHNKAPTKIYQKLGTILDAIKRKTSRPAFKSVMYHGRISLEDLPKLPDYTNNEGCGVICYSGMLGFCGFDDDRCLFKRVVEQDLSDDFVDKFVAAIKPALEKYLKYLEDNGNDEGAGRALAVAEMIVIVVITVHATGETL